MVLRKQQLSYKNIFLYGKSILSILVLWFYICMHSYHPIWETQKEAFFRRYRTLDPSVSQFDADIQRSVCVGVCV